MNRVLRGTEGYRLQGVTGNLQVVTAGCCNKQIDATWFSVIQGADSCQMVNSVV